MSKMFFYVCLCLMSTSAAFAQNDDLSGRYSVEGRNAAGSGLYRAEVLVSRSGETYRVRWNLGQGGAANGTGIVTDNVLSVVFVGPGTQSGIASFRINRDGTMTGTWAGVGAAKVGSENWKPVDRL